MQGLPVVEEDVWGPDLIRGKAKIFHSRMFALVPLEIVVIPSLQHTNTDMLSHQPTCRQSVAH